MNPLFRLWLSLSLAALAVAGCTGSFGEPMDDEATGNEPVAFAAVIADDPSHAAGVRAATITGEATTATITSMGVFAYYTGNANFPYSSLSGTGLVTGPNFMNNQEIARTGSTAPWTYSPVKYWPNEETHRTTFIGYAPHSSHFTAKDTETTPGNIPGGTFDIYITDSYGDYPNPCLDYAPRLQAEKQTDVLVTDPLRDKKKGAKATLPFKHLLSKAVFKVKSTEKIHLDRINIRGMTTFATCYLHQYGYWVWDDLTVEPNKVFYSLPNKEVPANTLTTVSTFFMIPYPHGPQDAYIDVHYTDANGTKEEKNNLRFSYLAADSGEAVDYTIVIDRVKLTVYANSASSSGKWIEGDNLEWSNGDY